MKKYAFILPLLQILLIGQWLSGVITWPWYAVFAPTFIFIGFPLVMAIAFFVSLCVVYFALDDLDWEDRYDEY